MNKLKLKFSVFEKRLAMQIIEQHKIITGTKNNPIDFKASNGIVIESSTKPGLFPELNQVQLRGEYSLNDLDVVYGKFDSTEKAIEFADKVKVAVNEYFEKINKDEFQRLSNSLGKVIKLNDCELLINSISGAYIIQVIKAKIENNDNLIKSEDFKISFDSNGDNLKIEVPFICQNRNCIVSTTNLTEDQVSKVLSEIIKKFSGISVTTKLDIASDNMYPNYYLHSS